jgi:hypothetical protein
MLWGTYSSNNENGFLKFNGPHRGRTAEGSFTKAGFPQVVETIKSMKVGEVKTYGKAVPETKAEKDYREDL